MLTRAALAAMIDHTILKPEATADQVRTVASEAVEYACASVCVNSSRVETVAPIVSGSGVKLCTVIGFPLGATITAAKVAEVHAAAAAGADEFDMVLDVGRLLDGHTGYVLADITAVTEAVRAASPGAILKVILESALLTPEQITLACELSRDAGADYVKTSTGFHAAGGASVGAIRTMAAAVPELGRKASGGVRTLQDALAMIEAGATRLGMSATPSVLAALPR
ncbi:MAG TPA: deoxyribose-phosphate aldolase [Jatrophihabitans sp.]|jgi:deoxyribose-phosphate aldolase